MGEAIPDRAFTTGYLQVVSKEASGFLIVAQLEEVCSKIAAN